MQSLPMNESFRIHSLYFFLIVKDLTAFTVKKPMSKPNQTIGLDISSLGGGERDRTDDLLLAKQALSQLSYTPSGSSNFRISALLRHLHRTTMRRAFTP